VQPTVEDRCSSQPYICYSKSQQQFTPKLGLQIHERFCPYFPLMTQFYPQQTIFSCNYPNPPTLFPSTYTTQGMRSPFISHSPLGLPTSLQGSSIAWIGISLVEYSKDVSYNRKISQQQTHLLMSKPLNKIVLHKPNNPLLH
jgi:hypothetical protein